MTRAALPLVIVMTLCATLIMGGESAAETMPGVNPALVEAWTTRAEGLKLSRFQAACDAGDKLACNEAAWVLEVSSEVQNRGDAKTLLASKGTCEHDRQSFYRCVHEGRLGPAERACKSGNAQMCRLWGKTLKTHLKRDYVVAFDAFSRGCRLGDGEACRGGATMVEQAKPLGLQVSAQDERWLREKACELGVASECWMVAQWHARGSHGYARNHAKYEEVMAHYEALQKAEKAQRTKVRAEKQQDALARMKKARKAWAATLKDKGPSYCVQHSTGRASWASNKRSWVRGTIEGDGAKSWTGCVNDHGKQRCEAKKGPAPKPMEQLFSECKKVLELPPSKWEYGFKARPDGALVYCYANEVGCADDCGKNVSTSMVAFGVCE